MTTVTQVQGTFRVLAIQPAVLSQLRERDDAGHPPLLVDSGGGSPLRCCLRGTEAGEQVALVSYAPLRRWALRSGADPGPYDEVGPVFVHSQPCDGPTSDAYPAAFCGPLRVFRAYGTDGRIRSGRLTTSGETADPDAAAAVIEEILADPQVAVVHARAVEFGCFTFEIRRRDADH